jgi:hypothetical protein
VSHFLAAHEKVKAKDNLRILFQTEIASQSFHECQDSILFQSVVESTLVHVDLFQNSSTVAKLLYEYSMHIVVGSSDCCSFDSAEQL